MAGGVDDFRLTRGATRLREASIRLYRALQARGAVWNSLIKKAEVRELVERGQPSPNLRRKQKNYEQNELFNVEGYC